jgi:hypothetical protein
MFRDKGYNKNVAPFLTSGHKPLVSDISQPSFLARQQFLLVADSDFGSILGVF